MLPLPKEKWEGDDPGSLLTAEKGGRSQLELAGEVAGKNPVKQHSRERKRVLGAHFRVFSLFECSWL